jgi:hypothetical protein
MFPSVADTGHGFPTGQDAVRKHVLALGQLMLVKSAIDPEDSVRQFAPPSFVAAIRPPLPPAKHALTFGQLMARKPPVNPA